MSSAKTAGRPRPGESVIPATRTGMGAIPHDAGVTFRVWAPHAKAVSVVGTFNDFDAKANPLAHEENGYWAGDVVTAQPGHEYKFALETQAGQLTRVDPYAREVTNSVGNGIIIDPDFDWGEGDFKSPPWNEMVIYELHVGTFNDKTPDDEFPAQLSSIRDRFDHLKALGVNVLQLMPVQEFAGDRSWGYNPAHIFAVESAYGGPRAFKQFVKDAHAYGFAVVLDVVYNHFGPSDLDLWRFDGWSENGGGGIYFYQDWRNETPWGATRPDYGREEVRQFIRDNAMMWLDEYKVDGLRMDMTLYIRSVRADAEENLPEGWSLLQRINSEVRAKYPNAITIAEDLQKSDRLTAWVDQGGAGFSSQWDANFVHPVREAVTTSDDAHRSMAALAQAVVSCYNDDAFQRVIYSESHDEVANGRARVPYDINPHDATGWHAQKRSCLAAALVLTSPGIPMLFQGQEFLEGEWFRDTVPVNWDQRAEFRGIVRLYRDLIRLRLNREGFTRGLTGHHVEIIQANDQSNILAFRRWMEGGRGDEVVVVANFSTEPRTGYLVGFPEAGSWELVLNSDWNGYSESFGNFASGGAFALPGQYDGQPARGMVDMGPYSVLIFARRK